MDPILETPEDAIIEQSELEKCFKVFDIHEKKKIDINELQSVRPESQVLEKMQHSKWATSNHLFDYNAFINDFYSLLEEYKEYKQRSESINNPTESPEKLPEILSSLKGSFFFNGDNVISHQYSMVMIKPSRVKIALEVDTRADIELFIFLIKQEEKNDMQYKFIAKTELLISTSKKESSNKLVWSGLLDKGVYVLIPSTTGCIFTKRKIQPSSDIHLTEIDDLTGDTILTSEYCQTIEQIFYQLDLDEKGCLSRAEFNLYNWRTSGLELNDEDWENLSTKLNLQDDEMNLAQFLELHRLEAKSGESVELWMALWTMGFNHNLVQDESFHFKVQITSQVNPMLKVFGLRSGGVLLEKATITSIMDGAEKLYTGSFQQLIMFMKTSKKAMSVVAQNSSSSDESVELDFTKSRNILINHPYKKFTIHLPKNSVVFIAHIIPEDLKAEFVPKVTIKTK